MGKLNRPQLEIKYCACGPDCKVVMKPGQTYALGHFAKGKPAWNSGKSKLSPPQPCWCGCLEMTNPGCRYIYQHARRKHKKISVPCGCGCLEMTKPGNLFIFGHSRRGQGKPVSPPHLCWCNKCGLMTNPGCDYIDGHQNIGRHLPCSEEAKQNMRKPKSEEGKANIKRVANERTTIANKSAAGLKRYEDPEEREKQSKILTKLWQDPEFRETQILAIGAGQDRRPNNPESLLKMIVGELYTGWRYTGDLSFVINGKNPDFVDEANKLVIEHYGDYWHDGEDPTDRAEIFAQAGYETCVIWEHELDNLDHVIGKLKRFCSTNSDTNIRLS